MKTEKIFCILFLILALSMNGISQNSTQLVYNRFNPYLLNPALTGSSEYGHIYFQSNRQWLQIKNGPQINLLSFDYPMKKVFDSNKKIGVGGYVYQSSIHLINFFATQVKGSIFLPVGNKWVLSMGGSVGTNSQWLNVADANIQNNNDLLLMSDYENMTRLNFSGGLNWEYSGNDVFQKFGIGSCFLQQPKNNYYFDSQFNEDAFFLLPSTLLVETYSKIKFNENFVFSPSVLLSTSYRPQYKALWSINTNLNFEFWNLFSVGFGLPFNTTKNFNVTGILGSASIHINELLTISYSYQNNAVGQNGINFGETHEVGFCFTIGKKVVELEKELEEIKQKMDTININVIDLQIRDTMQQRQIDSLANLHNIGYSKEERTINFGETFEITPNISVSGPNEVVKISTKGIIFQVGNVDCMNSSSIGILLDNIANEICDVLRTNPQAQIYILGHSDTKPLNESGLQIYGDLNRFSENRAATIRKRLIANECLKNRVIQIYGWGTRRPVHLHELNEDLALENRRVEIIIVLNNNGGTGSITPQQYNPQPQIQSELQIWWSSLPSAWRTKLSEILRTNQPTDNQLTTLLNSTSLDISNSGITDLRPINKFGNLQTLNCSNNDIRSLDNLRNLCNTLRDVNCCDTLISSLEPLSSMQGNISVSSLNFSRSASTSFSETHENIVVTYCEP